MHKIGIDLTSHFGRVGLVFNRPIIEVVAKCFEKSDVGRFKIALVDRSKNRLIKKFESALKSIRGFDI